MVVVLKKGKLEELVQTWHYDTNPKADDGQRKGQDNTVLSINRMLCPEIMHNGNDRNGKKKRTGEIFKA